MVTRRGWLADGPVIGTGEYAVAVAQPSDIAQAKQALREQVARLLDSQPPEQIRAASEAVVGRLLASGRVGPGPVMLFAPMATEIDVKLLAAPLAARGVALALPRIDDWAGRAMSARSFDGRWEALEAGRRGLLQPVGTAPEVSPTSLSAVVVPGLAFDPMGNRLGRGAGFYDRFLARLTERTWTAGVGLDVQLVPAVPCSPTDRPLKAIATPSRLIEPEHA